MSITMSSHLMFVVHSMVWASYQALCLTAEAKFPKRLIPRLQKRLPSSVVIKNKGIRIVLYYLPAKSSLTFILMKSMQKLQGPVILPPVINLNLVWHSSWIFQESSHNPTNWGGYMQNVCTGEHPPSPTIEMLPILDLNPSNATCIYSTLLFEQEQAEQLNIVTSCLTFDCTSRQLTSSNLPFLMSLFVLKAFILL